VAVDTDHMVYLRTMRAPDVRSKADGVHVRVYDDDATDTGSRPPIAGATVTVRDTAGHTASGVTQPDGSVVVPLVGAEGRLTVQVNHPDFSPLQLRPST
ncbi:MAG: hypothetical protein H7123_06010, partial [Thermoleophilia bacterium]|nr:hypothetical protein [Thermoleophilia bacterium]